MGSRRKTFSVDIPSHFESDNRDIQNMIMKLQQERPLEDQQKLIKKLSEYVLRNAEYAEFVAHLLCHIFLTTKPTYPVKKTLWRTFIAAHPELVIAGLCGSLKFIVEECLEETDLVCLYESRCDIVANFSACFDNFPMAVNALSLRSDLVTPFTTEHFIQLVDFLYSPVYHNNPAIQAMLREDIIRDLLTTSKFLLSLLQQCKVTAKFKKFSVDLLSRCQQTILDDSMNLDMRANCAFIMTITMDNLPKSVKTSFLFKIYPCLELIKTDNECEFNISQNSTALVCVFAAIMNVVPQEVLCGSMYRDVPVILYIFEQVVQLSKSFSAQPAQILIMSKALTSLSRMLNGIPLHVIEPMFKKGLEYIWINLDYYVDNVRHSTRAVFQNFVKLAIKHSSEGNPVLFRMIQSAIVDLLMNRHTHYVALTILSAEISCASLLEMFNNLPFLLLQKMTDATIALQICNTYESLMGQSLKEEKIVSKWIDMWVGPIKLILNKSKPSATTYYQRIIKHAFQLQPLVLNEIIHFQYVNTPNELNALLECLRIARKKNIQLPNVGVSQGLTVSSNIWRGYIEYDTIDTIMCHQSDEVRLSLLALIVETHKSTEVFTDYELNFLKKFFEYNVTSQEPYMKQDILAYYKKALTRMRESYVVLRRYLSNGAVLFACASETGDQELYDKVAKHRDLISKYEQFYNSFMYDQLKTGLPHDANYYRRSLCLELIIFIHDVVPEDMWNNFWHLEDYINLYDIFHDPYETNVALISQLLNMLSNQRYGEEPGVGINDRLKNFFNTACSLQPSETTRAAYMLLVHLRHPRAAEVLLNHISDPPVYESVFELAIFVLLYYLDEQLQVAESNLMQGITTTPFYGLILSIRHLLGRCQRRNINSWERFVTTIFGLCERMSAVVGPIVNNSSPEGFIPMQIIDSWPEAPFEGVDLEDKALAQKVLLFGWRSTKEMSLLVGEIMDKTPNTDPIHHDPIFTPVNVAKAESYFLKLFFETKHRGAYEQAYVGFCKLCRKLWDISENGHPPYPQRWLQNVLNLLSGTLENDHSYRNLCATRRSAGLPFMVQAILVSEPKNLSSDIFHNCISTLLDVAENVSPENDKSRTHALNVLRALYKHNQLGDRVVSYVPKGFMVAITGFDDNNWAIRNASTLLFASLITRTFGVQRTKDLEEVSVKNKMSAKVFFTRYPGLHEFLLKKFQQFLQSFTQHYLGVHPVLLILSRLYASNSDEEKLLIKYLPYVSICLQTTSYRTRDLAARAAVSIIPSQSLVAYISKLLDCLSDVTISNNYCHSILLQLKYLSNSINHEVEDFTMPTKLEKTFWILICVGKHISHFTVALYFDVVARLTSKFLKSCFGSSVFHQLAELLIWQPIHECKQDAIVERLNTAKSIFQRNRFFLHAHIVTNLYNCNITTKALYLKEFILGGLNSPVTAVNQFVLNYLIYINFKNPRYTRHSLFVTEEVEICEYAEWAASSISTDLRQEFLPIVHSILKIKLFPVLNRLAEKNRTLRYSIFLVLQQYPCVLRQLKKESQSVLNFLFQFVFRDDDVLFCAVLGCISSVVHRIRPSEGRPFHFRPIVRILIESSFPTNSLHRRLSTCQFLVANRKLLIHKNDILKEDEKIDLWDVTMLLLEDYERIVRDTISQIVTKETGRVTAETGLHVIPERAREIIVDLLPQVLLPNSAIRQLLSWGLRRRKNLRPLDQFEMFRTVDLNPFSEDEPLAYVASQALKKYMWKVEDGLSYDDYSIFIEEQALLIATKVRNALYRGPIPMVAHHLRCTIASIMRKMMEFFEERDIGAQNFRSDLEHELINVIMRFTFEREGDADRGRLKFVMRSTFGIV